MKMTSVAAMALLLGASTFALQVFAADTSGKPLPGNVGTEGHAQNPAKTGETGTSAGSGTMGTTTEDTSKLPGNYNTEGSGKKMGETADTADPGAPKGDSKMSTLPGNTGVEGHAGGGGAESAPKK